MIGSNRNDILTRFLETGIMATADVVPTLSPSMDIQVSSNFERLLFELNDRDGGMTAEQLRQFRASGSPGRRGRPVRRSWPPVVPRRRASTTTRRSAIMRDVHERDRACWSTRTPRSGSARRGPSPRAAACRRSRSRTAHPAKFPDAVERGHRRAPAAARPPRRPARAARAHRASSPNDLAAVEAFVERATSLTRLTVGQVAAARRRG